MVILDGGLRELTTGQVGVWNAQQLSPDSVAYNINTHFEIHGALDVDLFVEALRRAVAEAEAYRLRVRVVDGVPWQFVGDADSCPIHVIDVSAEADPQASAEEWMRRDAARVLNLTRDPLAVQAVFLLGPERFFWYQRVHHLIVDGYSTAVFGAVVARHYTALRERRESAGDALGPVSLLLDADAAYRNSDRFERDREFWRTSLSDLPADSRPRQRARWSSEATERLTLPIGPQRSAAVRAAAERLRVSTSELAIAAAAVYRYRVSGVRDVVLAVTVTGRTDAWAFDAVGMTATMMPLHVPIDPAATGVDTVRQTARAVRSGLRHQGYRYEDVVRDLKLVDGGPLFGLKVNAMPLTSLRFGDCVAVSRAVSIGPVEDQVINVYDRDDEGGIQIDVGVNRDLPDAVPAQVVAERFVRVLDALTADPQRRVRSVELLTAADRALVVERWNDTAAAGLDVPVIGLFERQVAVSPDAIALVADGIELTYAQVDARASRLAGYLRELGVGPESVVGLSLPHGVEMITAILAVWKTGGAYLPIDGRLPVERIAFMLTDCRAQVVVGVQDTVGDLPAGRRVRMVAVDDPFTEALLTGYPDAALPSSVPPAGLAYVMYTSGSTGAPKGVAITHGSLANYVGSVSGRLGWDQPGARYALLQPQVTDLGNTVLFASLSTGGQLHVLGADAVVDPEVVAGYLAGHRIDGFKVVPSHLAALSAAVGVERLVPAGTVVLGGEAAPVSLVRDLVAAAGDRRVFNHYGPTE
ncbi:AMP-binding protein, partial [Luedemannella flava]|uniref:AMP-binding protein n=1 Tax=Luedemannella flava TaxID=349316 RepID=UPI0031E24FCF